MFVTVLLDRMVVRIVLLLLIILVKEYALRGETLFEGSVARKVAKAAFNRIESAASDNRRAYSSPIYVEPRG